MRTRTGPHAFSKRLLYSSDSSRPSFNTASLITWKSTVKSRTVAASSSQRELTQAQGQAGSTQRSTCSVMEGSLLCGVCFQHSNDRVRHANRRWQVQHLVDRVRIGLRSVDAGGDELHPGVALGERAKKGNRAAFTGEAN